MKIARLALAFLLFTSPVYAAERASLVGTWHQEQNVPDMGHVVTDLTFSDDGTFHGHINVDGRRFWNFAGKWKLDGKWLHYDYTQSDSKEIPAGTKDHDRVLNITPTRLQIESEMGKETYVRKS